MGRLPVTAAVPIIKGAREKFGAELKTHSSCTLHGFYVTTDRPSSELTQFIVSEFEKLGATVEVSEDQMNFTYKYRNSQTDSKFYNTNNNAQATAVYE